MPDESIALPPVAIGFERVYAEHLVEALRNRDALTPPGYHDRLGRAVEAAQSGSIPPEDGWRVVDMLAEAGAAMFGAWSHGPAVRQPDLDPEQQAANNEAWIRAVGRAVEFISHVMSHVADGEWEFPNDKLRAVVVGETVRLLPNESQED
jgi:hypothetical protein